VKIQTNKTLFLALATAALTSLLRPENGLFVLFALSLPFVYKVELKKFLKGAVLLILFVPYLFFTLGIIKTYAFHYWTSSYLAKLPLSLLFQKNRVKLLDNS